MRACHSKSLIDRAVVTSLTWLKRDTELGSQMELNSVERILEFMLEGKRNSRASRAKLPS